MLAHLHRAGGILVGKDKLKRDGNSGDTWVVSAGSSELLIDRQIFEPDYEMYAVLN